MVIEDNVEVKLTNNVVEVMAAKQAEMSTVSFMVVIMVVLVQVRRIWSMLYICNSQALNLLYLCAPKNSTCTKFPPYTCTSQSELFMMSMSLFLYLGGLQSVLKAQRSRHILVSKFHAEEIHFVLLLTEAEDSHFDAKEGGRTNSIAQGSGFPRGH